MELHRADAEKRDKSFRKQRVRALILFVLLELCFALLIYRLLYIQCIQGDELRRRAGEQYRREILIAAKRGNIYDRNFQPLAVKLGTYSLYADPSVLKNRESASRSLSPILGISTKDISRKLKSKGYFAWLKRQLPDDIADSIRSLGIKGLGFEKEEKRYYPKGSLAAHIIGFVGLDSVGLDGIEKEYDSYMRGSPQKFVSQYDCMGRDLLPPGVDYDESTRGYHVVLTIDEVIQTIAEQELRQACEKWQAKSGSVIVMDPSTGEILALANCPTYDLNQAFSTDDDCKRNRAIRDLYEPGSVFKVITAAAAVNENLFTPQELINCENGVYKIGSATIHDVGSHELLTFSEVVEKSSNIGITKVAQRLGDMRLYKYIEAFGLTGKTGLDLSERPGFVRPLKLWTKRSMAAVPFGQEIAITPLQMLCSANAIANDGVMMRPFIVRAIAERNTEDNEEAVSRPEPIMETPPQEVGTPISSRTARIMKQILTRAVQDGTGENAGISGYEVAGKTGTAQKAGEKGYLPGKYISSFIGFLSAENFTISMMVVINEPQGTHTGGAVACPVFREIGEQVMQYLTVGQRFYVKGMRSPS